MGTTKAQQELIEVINRCIEENRLEGDYKKILSVASEKGMSLYETNLFIRGLLNKRRRKVVNEEGIIVATSSSNTMRTKEEKPYEQIPEETIQEKAEILKYKKMNKVLKRVFYVVGVLSAIIGLLMALGIDIPQLLQSRSDFKRQQQLSIQDLYNLTADFNRNYEVYRLYYFDVSASTDELDNSLSRFTDELSGDPDYKIWLGYAQNKDSKTKLAAWLMADPTSKYYQDDTPTAKFAAHYFAEETLSFHKTSNLPKELNEDNVEAVLRQLQALEFKNSFVRNTYFSQMFGNINSTVSHIIKNSRLRKDKHIIINIISDFYPDDLNRDGLDDIRDVEGISQSIERLKKLNVSVEFNLIQLKSKEFASMYGDLDNQLIGFIRRNFAMTSLYDLNDIILRMDEPYNKEGIKNMLLSINAATISLSEHPKFRKHLLVSKDGIHLNTYIKNPDDFRYESIGQKKLQNNVVLMLSGEAAGAEVKYDHYNYKTQSAYEQRALPVNSAKNETFIPPHSMRITKMIHTDQKNDFILMMYHLGLDKKFVIPLRQQ